MSFFIIVLCTTLGLAATVLILGLRFTHYRTPYATGRKSDKTCVLSKSPNHLGTADVVELAAAIAWKQLFQTDTLGYLKSCYVASQKCFKLPPLTFQGILDVDQRDARVFRRAVYGADASSAVVDKGDDVNPLFLVAMTGPVVILLLADTATPIRPMGALNTRNVFRVIDPSFCRDLDRIMEASRQQQLTYKAVFGGDTAPAYRKRSGLEFSITITIFHNYVPVLEQQLYNLQRLPKSFEPRFQGSADDDRTNKKGLPETQPPTSVAISQQDPRLWAASCKDYNPIHVSPIMAKAFGFKSVIAHGNHVAARVIEQLRTNASDGPVAAAQRYIWHGQAPYAIETRFLRPMLLPSQFGVWWETSGAHAASAGERADFNVGKAGMVNVSGSVYEAAGSR